MSSRLLIAVLLTTTAACGCASVTEERISFVADKPALGGWPWKRSPRPSVAVENAAKGKPSASTRDSATRATERFLESLPDDLRTRVETELADVPPDDRQRLLAYLATVEPARIAPLLDARKKPASTPSAEPLPVVTAAAAGRPEFELDADFAVDGQVEPASAETIAPAVVTPIARPRRNPLIEIQGVEFDESSLPDAPDVVAASREFPQDELSPAITPGPSRGPASTPTVEPLSPASPSTANPLARLKEWTTIRKPEPPATADPPVQTALAPADPSTLSLQGLSRRLRGGPARPDAAPGQDGAFAPTPGESPHLQEGLQRLISLMEAETARLKPGTSFVEREAYVRRHAELRMLYLMARQPTLALHAIPEADPETQEFWTSLMWSMSDYFDNETMADPNERAAAALDRLRAAEQHLQSTARLELRNLEFCDRIDGFGAYHPFENDIFRPGQPVLLYAEVRNFRTEVTPAGRYRTSLKSTIEIIRSGEDSELIERRHFTATEDQSRSPRTDYFHSYKLDLPLHVTPGAYSLRLTLEDELSGKIGTSTIDFLVR